jgi:hypothetical protein
VAGVATRPIETPPFIPKQKKIKAGQDERILLQADHW